MGLYGYTTSDLAAVRTAKMALLNGQQAVQVTVGGTTIIYNRMKLRDLSALEQQIFEDLYGGGNCFNKAQFNRPI